MTQERAQAARCSRADRRITVFSLLQKPVARAPDASSRIEHRYNNEITSDLSRMFYNRLTLRLMGHLCRLRCPRHGEDIETSVFIFLPASWTQRSRESPCRQFVQCRWVYLRCINASVAAMESMFAFPKEESGSHAVSLYGMLCGPPPGVRSGPLGTRTLGARGAGGGRPAGGWLRRCAGMDKLERSHTHTCWSGCLGGASSAREKAKVGSTT